MKVGDYVRTKDGYIGKIESIEKNERMHLYQETIYTDNWKNLSYLLEEEVFKSSSNIIDLIEVGDYVNGYKVTYVVNEEPCPSGKFVDIECDKDSSDSYFFENDIKTIVTKEMFESIEYKVGEKE